VKEQLKKLAAHDYAKTAFSYIERDTSHEYWVEVPEQPEDLDSAIDAEAASSEFTDGSASPASAPTPDLIASGESKKVEFKQTARVNLHTKQRDPVIEQMVVRSVAGFMNAEGGTLLIGVTDAGEVSGVETDYKTLGKKQDRDGFALWLNGLLDSLLGPTAVSNVRISFETLDGVTVCRVDVERGSTPTFARGAKGDADFYVRLNNATRLLNTAEALEYVRARWR
jgi:ATP-dependent Lon protease